MKTIEKEFESYKEKHLNNRNISHQNKLIQEATFYLGVVSCITVILSGRTLSEVNKEVKLYHDRRKLEIDIFGKIEA